MCDNMTAVLELTDTVFEGNTMPAFEHASHRDDVPSFFPANRI
jgi:hypothetical protein